MRFMSDDLETVKILIRRGDLLSIYNKEGKNILHCAALNASDEIIEFLNTLEENIKDFISIKDIYGKTPLDYARERRESEEADAEEALVVINLEDEEQAERSGKRKREDDPEDDSDNLKRRRLN